MKAARWAVLCFALAACSKKPPPAPSGNPRVELPPAEKQVLWVGEIPAHYKDAGGYSFRSQLRNGLQAVAIGLEDDLSRPHDATLTVDCSERTIGKFDNGEDAWMFTVRFRVATGSPASPILDFSVEAGSLKMEYVSKKVPVRKAAMDHLMDDPRIRIAPALVAAALGVKAGSSEAIKACLKCATREPALAALKAGGWSPSTEAEKAAWAIGTGDRAAVAAAGDAAVDAAMSVLSGVLPASDDVAWLVPLLASVKGPRAAEAQARVLGAMLDRKILADLPDAQLALLEALERNGASDALAFLDRIVAGEIPSHLHGLAAPPARDAAARAAAAIRSRADGKK